MPLVLGTYNTKVHKTHKPCSRTLVYEMPEKALLRYYEISHSTLSTVDMPWKCLGSFSFFPSFSLSVFLSTLKPQTYN